MRFKKNTTVLTLAAALASGAPLLALHAQTATPRPMAQHDDSADMAKRVKNALDADPGLASNHIDVSSEKGKVLMTGFVSSAQDMQQALRTANKTVGAENVTNKLKIKPHEDSKSTP